MWRCVLIAGVLLLSACGFSPLYTSGSPTDITIETISERNGQLLHNALLQRLNPRGRIRSSPYVLQARLSLKESRQGRTQHGVAATLTLTGTAVLSLRRPDGTACFRVRKITNFEIATRSGLAIDIARTDATRSLINALADDIARLAIVYREGALEDLPSCSK